MTTDRRDPPLRPWEKRIIKTMFSRLTHIKLLSVAAARLDVDSNMKGDNYFKGALVFSRSRITNEKQFRFVDLRIRENSPLNGELVWLFDISTSTSLNKDTDTDQERSYILSDFDPKVTHRITFCDDTETQKLVDRFNRQQSKNLKQEMKLPELSSSSAQEDLPNLSHNNIRNIDENKSELDCDQLTENRESSLQKDDDDDDDIKDGVMPVLGIDNLMNAPSTKIPESSSHPPSLVESSPSGWSFTYNEKSYNIPDITRRVKDRSRAERVGAFGIVAAGSCNGMKVAIKSMRKQSCNNQRAERDVYNNFFRNEVAILSEMHHSNVISLAGVFIPDFGEKCIIMPFIEDDSLSKNAKKHYSTCNSFLLFAYQIADGLNYIHMLNVIHGDIKPSNILVNEKGTPIIIDFGLASYCNNVQRRSLFEPESGTIYYMSPELHISTRPGYSITKMSDVWAFGMLLLALLSGDRPFKDMDKASIAIALKRRELPRRPIHPGCTNNLWDLVQLCWEEDPEARIKSEEVYKMLQTFVQ